MTAELSPLVNVAWKAKSPADAIRTPLESQVHSLVPVVGEPTVTACGVPVVQSSLVKGPVHNVRDTVLPAGIALVVVVTTM